MEYKNVNTTKTSTQLSKIKNGSKEIAYTYNKLGNIETITENGKVIKYQYDGIGQLIREDNQAANETTVYNYDNSGNIQTRKVYNYGTGAENTLTLKENKTYSYDSVWKDKLLDFNGNRIDYDNIGNPVRIGNDTLTWDRVDLLSSYTKNGVKSAYKYNANGIRTEKSVNGVTSEYILDGNKVILEKIKSGDKVEEIYYNYDSQGKLVSFNYDKTEYIYVRNAQQDIIGLVDGKTGKEVVSYKYDTWGKLLEIKDTSTNKIGEKNPYRYRGYRYDKETELYYLQARYYNPEIGRFINADAISGEASDILTHNMFAYCVNDPVNKKDSTGYTPETVWDAISFAASLGEFCAAPTVGNGIGLIIDGLALATPFIPGGAGMAKKGAKGVGKAGEALTLPGDKVVKCFTEGTEIKTINGDVNIEDIEVGDFVLSANEETGEVGYKKVTQLFVNEADTIVKLKIGNEEFETTESHPFYVIGEGWVDASELELYDEVILSSGKREEVNAVEIVKLEKPVTVYNFEVEDWHTYYVGDIGVLVHNMCVPKGGNPLLKGEGNVGTYKELVDAGKRGDNLTPHHMPSAEYMKNNGVSKNNGISMNMEQPAKGGRHRLTDTYGRNMTNAEKANYYSLSPRDALAHDLWNSRKIYMQQGKYASEIKQGLLDVIQRNKSYYPNLFNK